MATTSRSPTKTVFEKYRDWRHVYGLVQLIFESFSRQGCKKQTIKGINDYILSRQPDFFMKNREPVSISLIPEVRIPLIKLLIFY